MEKNLDGTREKPFFNVVDIDLLLGEKHNHASLETIVGLAPSKE